MSKLESKGALGDTISCGLELGDLVSWSEWMIVDNDIAEVIYYGTIIDKVAWKWLFKMTNYTGDYEFIYFD